MISDDSLLDVNSFCKTTIPEKRFLDSRMSKHYLSTLIDKDLDL